MTEDDKADLIAAVKAHVDAMRLRPLDLDSMSRDDWQPWFQQPALVGGVGPRG
jgi:hypothetical protein